MVCFSELGGTMGDLKRTTIGVAIPTRDRPQFLAETIESVLASSRPPDVIRVVDNSQHDPGATASICAQFSLVEYLPPAANLSMQANHNRAIQSIDADFLCVLHDDDLYGPFFLERAERALVESPAASLFAVNFATVNEQATRIQTQAWPDFPAGTLSPEKLISFAMRRRSPIHLSAAMMRTAVAHRHGLSDADGNCADMGFFFRVATEAKTILVDEPLSSIRVHGGMESAEAGFFDFRSARDSKVLTLAPLEFETKVRFLHSQVAQSTFGRDCALFRKIAAKRAVCLLGREIRNRSISPKQRLRVAAAAVAIAPKILGRSHTP
jgi:glycosyltransferase involved in cell wall biosynthesis